MLTYAQTLQSLRLDHSHRSVGFWLPEERQWRAFSRLTSLSVSRYSYRPGNGFFRALEGMHLLTKLRFEAKEEQDTHVLLDCLSLLTGLRSLTLIACHGSIILHEKEERHLMTLTQLTELSLNHYGFGYCWRFPTGIQSLTCLFSGSPPGNIAEILMSMTNLTSLSILVPSGFERLFHRRSVTPFQFSQEFGRLKHLSTLNVVVDDLFLEALGMLTILTSLQLTSNAASVDPYPLFPRLNNLSELVELKISSPVATPLHNDGFPQMCLPRIRKLDLPLTGTDASMRATLAKTLPCLRDLMLPMENYDR